MKNIVIVGMGALGIMYGHHFEKTMGSGVVTFLADDSRIEKYKSSDIYCNDEKCEFNFDNGKTLRHKADLLMFAVKSTTLNSAIELAKNAVGPNTIIMSVLNGIDSEEIISKELGGKRVIYSVAQGMDTVKEKNKVTYKHFGQLCIGVPISQPEKKNVLKEVTDFFDSIQMPYTEEADIMHRLWSKWMLNVGLNQVIMVREGNYGTVQKEGEAREHMKAAMREVIAIAEKEHIAVTEKDLEEYLALVDTLNPEGMPSMRQDGLAKRKSEVEMFAGSVMEKAARYGIPVPVNEKLYNDVKTIESSYR